MTLASVRVRANGPTESVMEVACDSQSRIIPIHGQLHLDRKEEATLLESASSSHTLPVLYERENNTACTD